MEIIEEVLHNLGVTFDIILKHFKSVDNYIVKSDDENIELLLKNEEDKAKFQNEIDKLVRENSKSREIVINNKSITISI